MALPHTSLPFVTVVLLAGCSPGKAPAPTPEPHPQKDIFAPLTQDLDRARDAQKDVDRNAAATRDAADAAEHGDPP